jgi:YHS domain-containing protein
MLRLALVLVLLVVLARAFWRLVDGVIEGASGRAPRQREGAVQMVRDPVCGTFVVPDRAIMLSDGARRLYFCSERCRDRHLARTA